MREDKSTRRSEPDRQKPEALPDGRTADRPRTRGDSKLVQRAVSSAKGGDREALHFLYVRYVPEVLDCVASLVSDQSEAEDITQGVFTELVTTIGEYDQRGVQFGAWILQVARNAALGPGAANATSRR